MKVEGDSTHERQASRAERRNKSKQEPALQLVEVSSSKGADV